MVCKILASIQIFLLTIVIQPLPIEGAALLFYRSEPLKFSKEYIPFHENKIND